MSASWIVSVGGRTYGPYGADQMETFVVEGRLAPHSLVARDEEGQFGPASQDPMLADFFQSREPVSQPPQNEDVPRFGMGEVASDEPSHFLVVADMKSGSITALEEEIHRLGPAYAVMPQAWILTCEMSIGPLRNHLVQKLGKLDILLVVDATHDKLSWFNLGMEAETRVRRIWTKQPQLSAA
jgi:hypothetical protein